MIEAAVLLLALVVLPSLLLGWLARRSHQSRLDLGLHAAAAACYVFFIHLWGQYPSVGSHYLRYLFPLLLMVAVGLAIKRSARRSPSDGPGSKHFALLAVFALLALVFGTLSLAAVQARSFPEEASTVPLAFPLRDGVYYVSDGGSNGVLNIHQKAHTPNQHYAIDVQKMSALGSTAKGFRSTALEDHHIFGRELLSPCAGRVAETRDGVADHVPLRFDTDDPLGNHVAIDCQGVRVVMLHLKQGSLLVEKGERLARGQVVGQVGNSGFSSEPHLHLQATKVSPGQSTFEGQGVPMQFEGRLLRRNDLVVVD